jgi:hypothetical protein
MQMSFEVVPNLQAFLDSMVYYSKKEKKRLEIEAIKELHDVLKS